MRAIRSEEGASMVEYAMLLAVLVIVAMAGVYTFGQRTNETFSHVGSSVVVMP